MTKPKWRKFEEKTAKAFGGKRVRGSGNRWFAKGDVKTDQFLIENKITQKKSYSISLRVLQKAYDEAIFSFRTPLLSIKIKDTEIIILFKDDFLKILEEKKKQ